MRSSFPELDEDFDPLDPPSCGQCGAIVIEETNPSLGQWHCYICGARWTEEPTEDPWSEEVQDDD